MRGQDQLLLADVEAKPQDVAVPDLLGLPATAAAEAVRERALRPELVAEAVADTTRLGLVVRQEPAANELVDQGDTVLISIGRPVQAARTDRSEEPTAPPTEPIAEDDPAGKIDEWLAAAASDSAAAPFVVDLGTRTAEPPLRRAAKEAGADGAPPRRPLPRVSGPLVAAVLVCLTGLGVLGWAMRATSGTPRASVPPAVAPSPPVAPPARPVRKTPAAPQRHRHKPRVPRRVRARRLHPRPSHTRPRQARPAPNRAPAPPPRRAAPMPSPAQTSSEFFG